MNERQYPVGFDCVWLASDSKGCLGVFITAGEGPIPVASLDEGLISIEEVEGELLQLPVHSQVKLLVSVPRPDDFIELARRGLFVYDWTDINRSLRNALFVYEPVAAPETPLNIDSLPADLRDVALASRLGEVEFQIGDAIDVRRYIDVVQSQ